MKKNSKLRSVEKRFLEVMGKDGEFKEYKRRAKDFSEFLKRKGIVDNIPKVSILKQ